MLGHRRRVSIFSNSPRFIAYKKKNRKVFLLHFWTVENSSTLAVQKSKKKKKRKGKKMEKMDFFLEQPQRRPFPKLPGIDAAC
jgi:hypothetical protein